MDVEDGLAGGCAGVEDEAELAVGVLVGELLGRPRRSRRAAQGRPRRARRRSRYSVSSERRARARAPAGAMSWNAMMRSFSNTMFAGISRATMRVKIEGDSTAFSDMVTSLSGAAATSGRVARSARRARPAPPSRCAAPRRRAAPRSAPAAASASSSSGDAALRSDHDERGRGRPSSSDGRERARAVGSSTSIRRPLASRASCLRRDEVEHVGQPRPDRLLRSPRARSRSSGRAPFATFGALPARDAAPRQPTGRRRRRRARSRPARRARRGRPSRAPARGSRRAPRARRARRCAASITSSACSADVDPARSRRVRGRCRWRCVSPTRSRLTVTACRASGPVSGTRSPAAAASRSSSR